ncbi:MAG: hypothetical protein PVF13_06115 [Chromatiales bacterium]|jgi:hypothetical protein
MIPVFVLFVDSYRRVIEGHEIAVPALSPLTDEAGIGYSAVFLPRFIVDWQDAAPSAGVSQTIFNTTPSSVIWINRSRARIEDQKQELGSKTAASAHSA